MLFLLHSWMSHEHVQLFPDTEVTIIWVNFPKVLLVATIY